MATRSPKASLLTLFVTIAAALIARLPAHAQIMPCEPYYGLQIPLCEFHYGTPVGPGRLTPPEDPHPSRCWYTDCSAHFVGTNLSFPLNLSMGFGPGMGDYATLTNELKTQIAKDAELIATNKLSAYAWHFFTSPKTGLIGPSAPLKTELRRAGIMIVYHP